MLLTVDVGNSNIVYGVFEGEVLREQYRVESHRSRTADEYAAGLSELLSLRSVPRDQIRCAIIASVVPALTEPMHALVRRLFGISALEVAATLDTGLRILYETPEALGADRLVNAVAGYHRVQAGVIVVDFGTATKFDCVSPIGEYLGGVIAPGLRITADALFTRAARLPPVELKAPQRVVGRNTVQSLQSGLLYGYVGLVEGLLARLKVELGFPCTILATGGLASQIAPMIADITSVDDALTLHGLRILYDRNNAQRSS
jgi:type III pantothenate kinase